jgi:glycerophosphoryl diester phosphodiesterase
MSHHSRTTTQDDHLPRITQNALQLLRLVLRDRREIVITHLFYSAIGLVVLLPSIGLFIRLALALSGKSALTNLDILTFILTPFGAVSLALLATFQLFVMAFELAALVNIAARSMRDQRISALSAIWDNLLQGVRILGFAWRLVLRILWIILPFVAAAAVTFMLLLTDYDINYYLSVKPTEFWVAGGIIVVVLAGMSTLLLWKLLDWCMAIPLLLFGDTSVARCFRDSKNLASGKRRQFLVRLALWAGISVMLNAVLVFLLSIIGDLLVPLALNSTQLLLIVLGGMLATATLFGFVVTAFAAGSFAYVVVDQYFEVAPQSATSIQMAVPEQSRSNENARLPFRRLILSLIAIIGVAALTGNWLVNSATVNENVQVIAHRGAAGRAPENTMASIRAAVEDHADWIEIDVQETADGEVVLLHDSDFMKLSGVNLKIWDGVLADVLEIDVGSWFGPEFADQRVPKLSEVLQFARGKCGVIIELKYYGNDVRLEERVIELVEQADMADDVMIMSLEYKGINKVRALRPNWTVGLLAAQAAGNMTQLDVDFLAVSSALLSPQLLLSANNAGKQVFVWTLNDSYSMNRAISMGVDGIITDEPALTREVLGERSDMTQTEHLLLHTALLMGRQPPSRIYRDNSP